MSKPETTFYTSVHKHLPPIDELHREKMSNPYRSGTADHWYSAREDLWVEWKFIIVPVRNKTMIDLTAGKKPPLSVLQQDWLRGRFKEGRDVAVIVGSKAGGVIMTNLAWERPHSAEQFRLGIMPRPDIAKWIQRRIS